jgi:hypothetical protein
MLFFLFCLLACTNLCAALTGRGYLVDIYCLNRAGSIALDGANMITNPEDHTIHCLRLTICKNSGFVYTSNKNPASAAIASYSTDFTLDAASNTNAIAWLNTQPEWDDDIFMEYTYTIVSGTTISVSAFALVPGTTPAPTAAVTEAPIFPPYEKQLVVALLGTEPALLQYNVSDPGNMHFRFVYEGDGWLGFGLAGGTGGMLGGTVLLGTTDPALPPVSFRDVTSRTAPVSQASPDTLVALGFSEVMYSANANQSLLEFKLDQTLSANSPQFVVEGQASTYIFAVGPSSASFVQHAGRTAMTYNLATGSTGGAGLPIMLAAHVSFAILAFGVFMPAGAAVALTRLCGRKDQWLAVHQTFMTLAVTCVIVAFGLGVGYVGGTSHFFHAHGIVGLVVFLLALSQITNGGARPALADGKIEGFDAGDGKRNMWAVLHRCTAASTLVLGVTNLILGPLVAAATGVQGSEMAQTAGFVFAGLAATAIVCGLAVRFVTYPNHMGSSSEGEGGGEKVGAL